MEESKEIQGSDSSTTSAVIVEATSHKGGLVVGTEYEIRIQSYVTDNWGLRQGGPWSEAVTATSLGLPNAPTALVAAAGHGQVALSWDDPNDESITGYQVQQDDGDWTDIDASGSDTTTHTVSGLTNGTTYSFSIRAVSEHGQGEASDAVTGTPVNAITISVGDLNPLVGQTQVIRAVLDDDLEYDEATYQWQRLLSSGWRDVGGSGPTKGVKFTTRGTRTDRVQVTLVPDKLFTSQPISITWLLPCIHDTTTDSDTLWSASVRAVAGRSEEMEGDVYRYTWYEYGWWEEDDAVAANCGGLADGDDTYLVKHLAASLSQMESETHEDYTNVGIHISFDGVPPDELVGGKKLVIGGNELALDDASNAIGNDRVYYYGWYTALDYEPDWWATFANSGRVSVSIKSEE